jgi:hypothetical protein
VSERQRNLFIHRKADEIASAAWGAWDRENAQPCVCGHTAGNHLEGGCRVLDGQSMCNCSTYEAVAAPQVHDAGDPYGPSGMDNFYCE